MKKFKNGIFYTFLNHCKVIAMPCATGFAKGRNLDGDFSEFIIMINPENWRLSTKEEVLELQKEFKAFKPEIINNYINSIEVKSEAEAEKAILTFNEHIKEIVKEISEKSKQKRKEEFDERMQCDEQKRIQRNFNKQVKKFIKKCNKNGWEVKVEVTAEKQ